MKYIQCPDVFSPKSMADYSNTVFLAGGISNCPDWQKDFVDYLTFLDKDINLTIINPRRNIFDISNNKLTKEQIAWEYKHLQFCDIKVFWFPKETLCPITLFELGRHCNTKHLYVGCDGSYARRLDIFYQMGHIRRDFVLHYDLHSLIYCLYRDFTHA